MPHIAFGLSGQMYQIKHQQFKFVVLLIVSEPRPNQNCIIFIQYKSFIFTFVKLYGYSRIINQDCVTEIFVHHFYFLYYSIRIIFAILYYSSLHFCSIVLESSFYYLLYLSPSQRILKCSL